MIDRASIVNWGATHPWPRQSFIEQDLSMPDYAGDVALLLRLGMAFDAEKAYAVVRKRFLARI